MNPSSEPELFPSERLLAFSDGVYAVAITLLVIDVRLPPDLHGFNDSQLFASLLAMQKNLLIFVFSFVIVGFNWITHHRKFTYIRRIDTPMLWLNLLSLLPVCLLPFATSVLSEHGTRIGFAFYALVMALITLLSAATSAYGLREPFLGGHPLPEGVRRDLILASLFSSAIFVGAALLGLYGLVSLAEWSLLLMLPARAAVSTSGGLGRWFRMLAFTRTPSPRRG